MQPSKAKKQFFFDFLRQTNKKKKKKKRVILGVDFNVNLFKFEKKSSG